MSSAPNEIVPAGAIALPIAAQQAEEYRTMLATKPKSKFKDYVRDSHEPAYYIDIAALERDLDNNTLPFERKDWPVCGRQWGISIANGTISQGEGGGVDLMYAASMPIERILKHLIIIEFPEGPSMVDGAHRIVRAIIDGRLNLPSATIKYADIAPYRVPEAQVENWV